MKIMYVVNSFGAGGAERHLLVLVGHMVSAGHSVLVVALTGVVSGGAKSIADDFVSAGAQIAILDYSGARWLRDLGRWYALRKTAIAWAPDIIHSHLPRADLAASFVKRALPNTVWISTIHDAYIKGVYAGYWVFRWLGWNWRLADHILTVSGHARRWVMDELRIPDAKTSIVYHGIASPPIGSQPHNRSANRGVRPLLVGCLSRFEQRKGIATLIKAMVSVCAKYPTARLVIAGSDPTGYANRMRKLAEGLRVGHAVDIQGFCDPPYNFLRQLDVFAFASSSEGFGIVLLEAMATGLPIVASNIYPLNYIVVDGTTGILANPADPEAFSSAICDLLGNPEMAGRMGEAGKTRCSVHFSEKQMMGSITTLYEDLTGLANAGLMAKFQ